MFKQLDHDMAVKAKSKKKKDVKSEFNLLNATFKSGVERVGGYVYNNLRRTAPQNDGKYMVKYNYVFNRVVDADIQLREPAA
jgi:hypothetical protein